MKDNIYISTVAFSKIPINKILETAESKGFNIEFSSGLPFNEKMVEIFLGSTLKRLPHNYFPAPLEPFVLNLASKDDSIRSRSINMCKDGLRYASEGSSNFYAAHAGFCIDPNPEQLGGQLNTTDSFNKEEHWNIFKESIFEILETASKFNVPFLIENNVIIKSNLMTNGVNPLFCCESSELLKLVKEINHPLFGVLLDTAHLKVSCNTLNLEKTTETQNLVSVIRALHHSDNDGLTDSNLKLSESYWFNEFLPLFKNLDNVIEVKNLSLEEIEEQEKLILKYF